MAVKDQKVIATCAIISVGIGSANAILKHKHAPSSRFLIGSGVAFLLLSALSEAEPDVAKGLAMGVMTTVLLGEGGGVLSYLDNGELDTAKPKKEVPLPQRLPGHYPQLTGGFPRLRTSGGSDFRLDTIVARPGIPQTSPHVLVNRYAAGGDQLS